MIATRSPTEIPAATNPFAVARISTSNSCAVIGCQPSPSGREIVIRSGSVLARLAMRSVRFPVVAAGIMAGVETRFMALTLYGQDWKREDSFQIIDSLRPCPRKVLPR